MGNRAVITSTKKDLAVYVHWNGGRDSVEAFLAYCKLRGFRAPETDDYGYARLIQVIANFMGANGLSVGVFPYPGDKPAAGIGDDNGVYVTENWEIVGRYPGGIDEQYDYPLDEMLKEIDASQPRDQQLGAFLDTDEVPTASIEIGDEVYMQQVDGRYIAFPVVGIGDGRTVNGFDTTGAPYVQMYNGAECADNVNNYVRTPTVRRIPR